MALEAILESTHHISVDSVFYGTNRVWKRAEVELFALEGSALSLRLEEGEERSKES